MRTKSLNLILVFVTVLCLSTTLWATDVKPFAALVSQKDSKVVTLHLHTSEGRNVKVTFKDANGNTLFTDNIKNANGVIRPYNLKKLENGSYNMEVSNKIKTEVKNITVLPTTVRVESDTKVVYHPYFNVNSAYVDVNMLLLEGTATLVLVDTQSNELYRETCKEATLHRRLDVKDLPKGQYRVLVMANENVYTQSFIL